MLWLVKATPYPFYPRERDPVPTVQEAGWALGLGLPVAEKLAPPGIDVRTVQILASRCTECAITYTMCAESRCELRLLYTDLVVKMCIVS